ncbi:MAG: thioredoxin family protein [Erysipelotrichaceae bacterium]|nr:thioredoxin family protein [Erysipelotrichaceae bacterium]MDP3305151.1 thioredoxin family protein [Erysipelotrichaceae bacterium]
MKKFVALFILLLTILAGCTTGNDVTLIKASDAIERLDAAESMVLVIGISTCAACKEYKPIVREIVKNYDVEIFYVELDSDVNADITSLVEKYLVEARWTPTTYIFKNGVLVESKTGAINYSTLKDWLQLNDIIE